MTRTLNDLEDEIQEVLQTEIAPYIASHGGGVEYLSFVQGEVRVRLFGACEGCSAQQVTLAFGIERMLRKKFREVHRVVLMD
jgi:Fe-S cluster biogenesis protein NfuA